MASKFMKRALALARRGLGRTSPNPMVGAVVVDQRGQIIAEGYHKTAGSSHAEVIALSQAGPRAYGQTLYVTLEPCNHQGRTPPCTDAIIQAGIRQVVVAVADPNPAVAGGGIDRLKRAGIEVRLGDGQHDAEQLNRAFFMWCRQHRPWVTLKAAMTLDGKVAAKDGQSKYLTSEAALMHAHELRRQHDAILVGSGTVLADDPRLTYRGARGKRSPVRIILDARGRISTQAQVFGSLDNAPTLVFASEDASVEWEREIFGAGGEVVRVPIVAQGHLHLGEVLNHLADRRILSVLVEGGPTVHAAFIASGLADQWVGYLAPLILGGVDAPSAVGGEGFPLTQARQLEIHHVLKRGPDIIVDALFKTSAASTPSQEVKPVVHRTR